MSLKDRLNLATSPEKLDAVFDQYGILDNPFPASSQTAENPHFRIDADEEIEARVASFIRDKRSQVVVIVGTQGTGKTNVLNFYEKELKDVLEELEGYYVVRYLADPEASFEGTLRRLFQEFTPERLSELGRQLAINIDAVELARNHEVRIALRRLAADPENKDLRLALTEWFLGLRVLKTHKEHLGVNFRLDSIEAKTAAFRDLVQVSSRVGLFNGIFLLLDELEKQDGVLSATAVVRYLSSLRAIIDALPDHLFMMIAITPDALRRYSVALPAFRSRLENRIELQPLKDFEEATRLAQFYLQIAMDRASEKMKRKPRQTLALFSVDDLMSTYSHLAERAKRFGDAGLRQREFLHALHVEAEKKIHEARS